MQQTSNIASGRKWDKKCGSRQLGELITLNRPFAGQGHVTMSIIKKKVVVQNGCQKLKEHGEIGKVTNFQTAAT